MLPDLDPEADDAPDDFDDSQQDSSDGDHVADARQHYASVSKSKLRQPKTPALGPQYRGARIARDAVEEEDGDDAPFNRDSSDGDSGAEDSEGDNSVLDSFGGNESDQDGKDDDATSDTQASDDEAMPDHASQPADLQTHAEVLKEEARARKTMSASLAQSLKAEAEKGRAIKTQKAAFDSLLNARVKLQKALVGSNTLVGAPSEDLAIHLHTADAALQGAEDAAFALWSSLNALREDMVEARTGEKRKRNPFNTHSSNHKLWDHMRAQEEASRPHRNATLQRWAGKSQAVSAHSENGIIKKSAKQPSIVDMLQEHLSNREHLLKRARTPRSCAPIQAAKGVSEDDKIYDDADFYGLLLKELLDQRNANSATSAIVDFTTSSDLRRAAKTRKNVDTKASKGRKLRYTVHEKLQNFMAPEDRSTWSERQADELFGSLFGQRIGLGEDRDEGSVDGLDENDEEAGLMLFRR